MAKEERGGGGTQPCEQCRGRPWRQSTCSGRLQLSTRQRHDRRRHTPHARRRRRPRAERDAQLALHERGDHAAQQRVPLRSRAPSPSADRTERASCLPHVWGDRPPQQRNLSGVAPRCFRPRAERRALAEWRDSCRGCSQSARHGALRRLPPTWRRFVAAARRLSAPPPPPQLHPVLEGLANGAVLPMPGSRQSHVAQGSRSFSFSVRARHRRVPPPGCPPAHDARRARGALPSGAARRRGRRARACSTHEPSARRCERRTSAATPRPTSASAADRSAAAARHVLVARRAVRIRGTSQRIAAARRCVASAQIVCPREDAAFQLDAPPSRQSGAQLGVARRVLQPGGHAPRCTRRGGGGRTMAARGARAAKRVRRRRKKIARRQRRRARPREPLVGERLKGGRHSRRAVWRRRPPHARASPARARTVSRSQRAAGDGGAYAQAVSNAPVARAQKDVKVRRQRCARGRRARRHAFAWR